MYDDVYFSVPPPPSRQVEQQQQQQQPHPPLHFQSHELLSSNLQFNGSCHDSIYSSLYHQNLLLPSHHHHDKYEGHYLLASKATSPSAFHHHHHLDTKNSNSTANVKIITPTDQLLHQNINNNNNNGSSSNRPKPKRPPAIKKDRHTKICTAKGLRDRRVRLSMNIAREFFNLQDALGFDKASKTLGWLLAKSRTAIEEVAMEYNNNKGPRSRLLAPAPAPAPEVAVAAAGGNSNSSCLLSGSTPSHHESISTDHHEQKLVMNNNIDHGERSAVPIHREKIRSAGNSSSRGVVLDYAAAREMRAKARARARERAKEKMMSSKKQQLELPHHHDANHQNHKQECNFDKPRLISDGSDIEFKDQGNTYSRITNNQVLVNESIVIKSKPKALIDSTSASTPNFIHDHHQGFVPILPLGSTNGAIPSSNFSAFTHVINMSNGEFTPMGQKSWEICANHMLH